MRSLANFKLSVKIPFFIIMAAIFSCVSASYVAQQEAGKNLIQAVESKKEALLASRKIAIEKYLQSIVEDLNFTSVNKETIDATKEFIQAWRLVGGDKQESLKRLYITDNPFPTGEKEKLDYAPDGSLYSQVHRTHHPVFRRFLNERGYYDIFLFDLQGNLIYSVFKELDYATNLNTGVYKETDLGNAFRAAADTNAKAGNISFFDFKPYAPSHGAPASFISTPIFDGGKKIGVLVFQMPIDRINKTMAVYSGLGETGETYIVGPDRLMRSDSRFSKESTILKAKIDSPAIEQAIAGQSGAIKTYDYRGSYVSLSYSPLEFYGTRWAIVGQMDVDEIMQPITKLQQDAILIAVVVVIVMTILGYLASLTVTRPLTKLNEVLNELALGNTNVVIPLENHKDEIGDIAKSAKVFKENAIEKKKFEKEREESQAKLERERKETMARLAEDFEKRVKAVIASVASASTQLAQTSQNMSVEIEHSARSASEASTEVENTTQNVQSVASAAEEMSSSVKEVNEQMSKTDALVKESVAKVTNADEQTGNLTDAAKRVSAVVEIISEVSEQINLLALNATIESARAGEAGRGFEVVANEIKNLASQTDKSISEIRSVIEHMVDASDDIVQSLNSIRGSVDDISHSSSSVSAAVEEQSAATSEIARSMQTASSGAQIIDKSIAEVSKSCSGAANSSQEVLSAAQELSRQAEALDTQVKEFINELRA